MSCPTFLQGINTSCGANMASIKEVWVGAYESAAFTYNYQEAPEGSTYPYVDEDGYVTDFDGNKIIESVDSAVLGLSSEIWVHYGFRKNTGEMTTEMTRSDNGSYYFTNTCNLVFSKQDKDKRLALQATAAGDCTIIVRDSNDIYWLIGTDSPVTATTLSATTGTAIGDNNQYTVTLGSDEKYMPIPLAKEKVDEIINALTGGDSE